MNRLPQELPKISMGENVEIHSTVDLGGPGYSLEKDEDGAWVRCNHHGDISIGDDVHIDAFTTVRRATLKDTATIIGKGAKLCTYVNVGHNCKIGEQVFIGPHVCLNGSVKVEDGCWISGHAVIREHVTICANSIVGLGSVVTKDVLPGTTVVGSPAIPIQFVGNYVHPSFIYGRNLKIGKFNYIGEAVEVGDGVTIRSHTELRPGTLIGDFCYIDSGVKSSGYCKIGNHVTLRYDSIIAKGTIIEDHVFISPQLMTENLDHKGRQLGGAHIGTGRWHKDTTYRVFIGTNVTLAAGIEICSGTIIGSKSNVRKSITEPGVYFGNPAKQYKK